VRGVALQLFGFPIVAADETGIQSFKYGPERTGECGSVPGTPHFLMLSKKSELRAQQRAQQAGRAADVGRIYGIKHRPRRLMRSLTIRAILDADIRTDTLFREKCRKFQRNIAPATRFAKGKKMHDFFRKSGYFSGNRKLCWISRSLERHSTILGISYRHLRHGKRDYPN
jgi:hypothetical protein